MSTRHLIIGTATGFVLGCYSIVFQPIQVTFAQEVEIEPPPTLELNTAGDVLPYQADVRPSDVAERGYERVFLRLGVSSPVLVLTLLGLAGLMGTQQRRR